MAEQHKKIYGKSQKVSTVHTGYTNTVQKRNIIVGLETISCTIYMVTQRQFKRAIT